MNHSEIETELASDELISEHLSVKYEKLKEYFKTFQGEGICIAYSGGVDSTLLLRTAADVSSRPVLAVILETQLHPHSDTEAACRMAAACGAGYEVIRVDEFQNPDILQNPVNRCYLCKHMLFSRLKELAFSKGFHAVFDGTNKDDEKEYRPGMKVLRELNIKSPLLELGITKREVRLLSGMLQLPTARVPSTPCLATRLPYGAYLDRALLQRIHKGEELLRNMGFYNVRLRFHDPVLRIELDTEAFPNLLEHRSPIIDGMKSLGFSYLTLDLEGFRSGSMDINII